MEESSKNIQIVGWDLIYKVVEKSLKHKCDIIITLIHWILIMQKDFKCIGNEKTVSQKDKEDASDLLPEGWNEGETYSIRYLNNGNIYIVSGAKTKDVFIVNFLRVDTETVSSYVVNVEDVVLKLHGSLKELLEDPISMVQKISSDLIDKVMIPKRTVAVEAVEPSNLLDPTFDILQVGRPRRADDLRDIGVGDLNPFGNLGGGMIFPPRQLHRPPFGESHNYKTLVHNEDFNFVWGEDLNKYRPFAANIELAQFNGEDFGPQGEIADRYHWAREVISYDELKLRLLNSAKLINSEHKVKLISRVQSTLIENILGFKKSYNVQTSLEFLRNIKSKTLEQKLLSRVLALSSYDALDKVTLKNQNVVKEIYNDLYFIEKDLLPQAKKSSAVNFISFCLYQDSERKIRIHKIMPSTQNHDEFPHTHYGSCASSLLAGALVNQHLAVIPAKYALDANFGLYLLTRTSFTGPKEEQTKVSFFQTNVKVGIMSSHLYKYGDHYFLPGPRDIKNDLTINDTLVFHRVGTKNYAITLFSQQMSGRTSTHTTYNIGNPSIIYKKFDSLLSQRESVELMKEINKIIKTQVLNFF